MKNLLAFLRNRYSEIYKLFLFLLAIAFIVYLLPKEAGFGYEYMLGQPWKYETLIASQDFPVLKSEKQLANEKKALKSKIRPYFNFIDAGKGGLTDALLSRFDSLWVKTYGFGDEQRYRKNRELLSLFAQKAYHHGVILLPDTPKLDPQDVINVIKNKVLSEHFVEEFYTPELLKGLLQEELKNHAYGESDFLQMMVGPYMRANIRYDKKKTQMEYHSRVERISPFDGMVQKGQLIISKGEVVNQAKYRILESMKKSFENDKRRSGWLILLGQIVLVAIPLFALVLYLIYFLPEVFEESKSVLLILLLITLMVVVTRFAQQIKSEYILIIPLMINILIIRSFYDNRLALIVHLITILLVSYFVPSSFQFLFLQVITGIITIISVVKLHNRSRFFLTAVYIFLSYSVMYLAMTMILYGDLAQLEWKHFMYFAFNAGLVLLSFPLIYILEKIFGMITDLSLLEYADTNNALIRDLVIKAPGTFQHSVQVANLAEEAIREIGGNPLLVRAGAMYHDIGKSLNPVYFTENQQGDYSPHNDLSFEESARIILDHVVQGVELARKNKIPEQIIDFIRTHHGTKRVEYFYRMSLKEKSLDDISLDDFTYKGPIPYSRETCVLMMADAVEAASRSIKNPNSKNISDLVDNIIKSQLDQHQYDNSDITLRDINTVKKILKKRLMSIYHVRIEYPD